MVWIPTVVASVTFLKPEDGGRTRVPSDSTSYAPHLVVGDPSQRVAIVSAKRELTEPYLGIRFSGNGSALQPGIEHVVTLALPYFPEVDYSALVSGATFTIREGPKVVGFGYVINGLSDQPPPRAEAPSSGGLRMSVDALIEIASVRSPQVAEVDAAAGALGMSVSDVCDELSRTVAERFVQGVYSFTAADFVMNNISGFAHAVSGEGLPALAWSVYLAFDAGEYEHPEDPPELQGEYRTRVLLAQIPSLGFPPAPPEDPAWRLAHRASARFQAVEVAKQVLLGQISPVIGAQELLRLRPALGVAATDDDFQVFHLIDSESHGVPIGPIRKHWSPDALAAKAEDVRRTEEWAFETGETAFRQVVSRFGEPA